jgi:hypothetical protein
MLIGFSVRRDEFSVKRESLTPIKFKALSIPEDAIISQKLSILTVAGNLMSHKLIAPRPAVWKRDT